MPSFRKFLNKIKSNLILILIIPLALIAPDFIAQFFHSTNEAELSGKFLLGVLFFGIFLALTPRIFAFTVLGFFIFLELIQFSHLFYYNSLISSTKFPLLFDEFDEVWQTAGEAISFLYLVPFIVLIPYGLLILAFNKLEPKRFKSKWSIIAVLLILAIIPYRVNKTYNGVNYYPDPTDHSLRNSLYAYNNYLLNIITPNKRSNITYEDYKIEPIDNWIDNDANIILIIGESVNPKHMSLFGYERNTNPLLSSLKLDPNFSYMKAISGGVNTIVSTQILLNGIYEPNNYKAIEKTPVNLFKLAKQHNFKSFYISAQSGALLTNVGAEFIDHVVFRKKEPILFNKYQDEALLKIIPELDYSDKNFIVLHQRSIHAPYESNYSHNPSFNHFPVNNNNYQEYLVDTYDNATLYNDYLLHEIIKFYKNKFTKPTYIFFTPDHSEGIGHNNIYGHAFLNEEVYNIMFLSYVINGNPQITKKIKAIKQPICHYEIHNIVAKILGFNINNPNLELDTCYVQGVNLYGLNEFIRYNKS